LGTSNRLLKARIRVGFGPQAERRFSSYLDLSVRVFRSQVRLVVPLIDNYYEWFGGLRDFASYFGPEKTELDFFVDPTVSAHTCPGTSRPQSDLPRCPATGARWLEGLPAVACQPGELGHRSPLQGRESKQYPTRSLTGSLPADLLTGWHRTPRSWRGRRATSLPSP
jgi:hypothetical protein